jgi:hypothetical protein
MIFFDRHSPPNRGVKKQKFTLPKTPSAFTQQEACKPPKIRILYLWVNDILSKPAQPSWRFMSVAFSEEASTIVMRAYLKKWFLNISIKGRINNAKRINSILQNIF